ncbi:hypothetical protein BTO20_38725 (plasmid) [Mycobacterium dioxanotrophicus]|uniref:Serine/threonine protein kinase n=1 Tax=Mycobacterium dioxanotrophicus TaxID=482462 RepID=A0A1Y0CH06_9MYCO|nr:hypothetical protein [Mycobacterium dioxanotrophicus]ART74530.1 hypothetical protein BTO20_38725 [Mycobacterium dioxanotrophicus]
MAGLSPGPAHGDNPWQRFYDSPTRPRWGGRLLWAGVAAGVVVAAVVTGGWLMVRSPGSSQDAADSPRVAVEESAVDTSSDESEADQVMALLPAGYPSQACAAVEPAPSAAATVDCARNLDPGGPATSTYTAITERADLDAAFGSVVEGLDVVVCPGNIQSPGPWRRSGAGQPVGTLVCGLDAQASTVAWTDTARSLLVVARGAPTDRALAELYTWWSSHS